MQRATKWLRVTRKAVNHPDPNPVLDEAIAAFTEVLAHHGSDTSPASARLRFQRAIAYTLRGQPLEADADFNAALEGRPADAEIRQQYAVFQLHQENADAAIEVLAPVGSVSPSAQNSVMFAHLLLDRSRPVTEQERAALESIAATIGQAQEESRLDYMDTLVRLLCNEGRSDEALSRLHGNQCPLTCKVALNSLTALIHRIDGETSKAEDAIKVAIAAISPDTSELTLAYTANTCASLSQFSNALEVWKKVVSPTWYGSETECALECAGCDDDKFILEFCAGLRKSNLWEPYSVELEVSTLEKYNEFDDAIAIIDAYLPAADDQFAKMLRVRRSVLGRRIGKPELAERDPAKLPDVDSVSSHLGRATAAILCEGPHAVDGVRYAYELVRNNFESADAHMALVAAVGIGEHRIDGLPDYDTAQPGWQSSTLRSQRANLIG